MSPLVRVFGIGCQPFERHGFRIYRFTPMRQFGENISGAIWRSLQLLPHSSQGCSEQARLRAAGPTFAGEFLRLKDQFARSCLVGPGTRTDIGTHDLIRADPDHIDGTRAINELITRFKSRHVIVQLTTRNGLRGWRESAGEFGGGCLTMRPPQTDAQQNYHRDECFSHDRVLLPSVKPISPPDCLRIVGHDFVGQFISGRRADRGFYARTTRNHIVFWDL